MATPAFGSRHGRNGADGSDIAALVLARLVVSAIAFLIVTSQRQNTLS